MYLPSALLLDKYWRNQLFSGAIKAIRGVVVAAVHPLPSPPPSEAFMENRIFYKENKMSIVGSYPWELEGRWSPSTRYRHKFHKLGLY